MPSPRHIPIGILWMLACQLASAPASGQFDSVSLKHLDQTDLIQYMARLVKLDPSKQKTSSDKLLFSIIPIAPASAGGGNVAVSAINVSFYLGKQTNLSTVYFYPYTNFAGNYGVILSPYIWFNRNQWNGTGDFRLVHNELVDYGLGTSSSRSNATSIHYSHLRTYFAAHRRVKRFFYIGGGYNLDDFYNVRQVDSLQGDGHFIQYPYGTGQHTMSSGLTINLLRDNRENSVNPDNGFYSAVVFRFNTKWLGSTYEWTSLLVETRKYFSFSEERHKILAFRTFYWGTYGDVPYLNLPATFQDPKGRAGRGYAINRYRGKQMLYGEAEYRFDLSSRGFLGGVVFVNAQSLSEQTSNAFQTIRPAAGAGLRLKFNRNSDTNITLDGAWGKEGFQFYINLGEFF